MSNEREHPNRVSRVRAVHATSSSEGEKAMSREMGPDGEALFVVHHDGIRFAGDNADAVREYVLQREELKARERMRDERWPGTALEQMSRLARSFPTLEDADGVSPWDVDRFIAWLNSGAPGHGAACAGRFVLGVWNTTTNWAEFGLVPPGRFDLYEAMSCWDAEHVEAMMKWIEAPFWP